MTDYSAVARVARGGASANGLTIVCSRVSPLALAVRAVARYLRRAPNTGDTMRRSFLLLAMTVIGLSLGACVPSPQTAAPQRVATPVNASSGKTWDAVIDMFAERNIPIRNMERASGLIVAEPMRVTLQDGVKWADCGGDGFGNKVAADRATYNVLVRGDSTRATVRTTVLWESSTDRYTCTTKGVWEQDFESLVKARAEGTAAAR